MHDTPGEIAQALDVKDWKKGEVEPIPGKTMPAVTVVERDYPNLYKRFTALGPLMEQARQWRQGHRLEHRARGRSPASALNGAVTRGGASKGLARIETDIDATEVILSARARDQRRGRGEGLGGAVARPPAATTPISRCRRRTRRSASATSSRSRARSSRRRPGRAWRARRSATTPATPTCTS